MPTLAIFGRGELSPDDSTYQTAYQIAKALAAPDLTIMTGGYAGVMEAASQGAVEGGGQALGITTDEHNPRPPNPWLTQEIRYPTYDERLDHLVYHADGYVILPGSTGTYMELREVLIRISEDRMPAKPIALWTDFWRGNIASLLNSGSVEADLPPLRYFEQVEPLVTFIRKAMMND